MQMETYSVSKTFGRYKTPSFT